VRALVTGSAGFIGSQLAESLVLDGHEVRGVDCFTPYYETELKRANLAWLAMQPTFELIEADLRTADIDPLLDGVEVVFHLAAQPGVRSSWGTAFSDYLELNALVTQRVLESARHHRLERLVYASSSSVYGTARTLPTPESEPCEPRSPYGVTKLAGEHLCALYAESFGVPVVSLRYFSVYGPRQRPDMALGRLIEAGLTARPFRRYGRGDQVRDLVHVADVVAATSAAGQRDVAPGTVINVASGEGASLHQLVALVEEAVGKPVPIESLPGQPGEVQHTLGDNGMARRSLGWEPRVPLESGVRDQVAFHRSSSVRVPPLCQHR
jgi:UDP-glucuronate 4-epimerase